MVRFWTGNEYKSSQIQKTSFERTFDQDHFKRFQENPVPWKENVKK